MIIPVVGTVPARQYKHDAGADLRITETVNIPAGGIVTVDTGTAVAIPEGYVGKVYGRSGLAFTNDVALLNSVGIIDSGYRDTIKVRLINHGKFSCRLLEGSRVAQLVVQKVKLPEFEVVDELPKSKRDKNGLGSTGVRE